ncbi:MAG: TetR/AcrR family transcriptional regulator [Pseudomonadota bacterium]
MSSTPADTRTRILGATLSALAGGEAARVADIAKAAGISRQALYLHFPTRADLLIAAARHLDALRDVDARLAESRAAATGQARLDAFVAAWGAYIPEIHGVATALRALQDRDAAARAAWDDRRAAIRDGCAAAVAALARDGALAPEFSDEEATDLLAALLSVETWEALVPGAGWSQERFIAAMQAAAARLIVQGPVAPREL